jgi:hypothetical protein
MSSRQNEVVGKDLRSIMKILENEVTAGLPEVAA